ncbi:hypothetical protein F5146DRAFT_232182 [Armillaria mellea]|nr:hypothetical protein F5146DRAFT_232182 [Armillaria mellea]
MLPTTCTVDGVLFTLSISLERAQSLSKMRSGPSTILLVTSKGSFSTCMSLHRDETISVDVCLGLDWLMSLLRQIDANSIVFVPYFGCSSNRNPPISSTTCLIRQYCTSSLDMAFYIRRLVARNIFFEICSSSISWRACVPPITVHSVGPTFRLVTKAGFVRLSFSCRLCTIVVPSQLCHLQHSNLFTISSHHPPCITINESELYSPSLTD